jgi:beta-1,4-mannosyltransferase
MTPATQPRATVLVFGDLARSPRMLNHALAMAESGMRVALAGYLDSELEAAVASNPEIKVHTIRTFPRCPESFPRIVFLVWSALRLVWAQIQALWLLLIATPRPQVVLVQNPPTVPTLLVGRLAARLRSARFLIDWHNFGYSMLALRLGAGSVAVKLLRRYEGVAGRRANAHLCVSQAMAAELATSFGIRGAQVLHDRPRRLTAPLTSEQRAEQIHSLFPDAPQFQNALTLHCPTSWTDDEDVGMLLDAIQLFEARNATPLCVVVSGRGPRRSAFEARLDSTKLQRCEIRTAFLPPEDYRRLLAAADCGVSLHRSSSGVDLPMKLVDFFGAGTPALALDYGACLREQVQDGREVLLFRTADELAQRLSEITYTDRLARLRGNVRGAWGETWSEAWRREALPLLGLRT